MDHIDHEILKILNENSRTSFKKISEKIGLTSPAVKSRIEKLEQDGIISGYSLSLNPKNLGFMVSAFISIAVEPHLKADFFEYIKSCPNIAECHGITGEYFAILKVYFPSTMELDNFLSTLQKFGETSTNIVLSTYKESSKWID